MRHVIDDGKAAGEIVGRDEGAVRGEIGTHVGEGGHAQCQEAAVAVEGQSRLRHAVARLIVAHEGLGAGGRPTHGPAELARGDKEGGVFGIARGLHAEAAADIAGQDAQLLRRHAEGADELVAQHLSTLRAGMKRQTVARRVIARDGTTRLERGHDEALACERQARDECCSGEASLDLAGIAIVLRCSTRPIER